MQDNAACINGKILPEQQQSSDVVLGSVNRTAQITPSPHATTVCETSLEPLKAARYQNLPGRILNPSSASVDFVGANSAKHKSLNETRL